MTYEVGQEVVQRATQRRGDTERVGTVVKVSRKYCTVEFKSYLGFASTLEFDKETGFERSNGFMPASQIQTADEWAALDRRSRTVDALRQIGVSITNGKSSITNEQVEAVANIFAVQLD
jgi:hypothetical protein